VAGYEDLDVELQMKLVDKLIDILNKKGAVFTEDDLDRVFAEIFGEEYGRTIYFHDALDMLNYSLRNLGYSVVFLTDTEDVDELALIPSIILRLLFPKSRNPRRSFEICVRCYDKFCPLTNDEDKESLKYCKVALAIRDVIMVNPSKYEWFLSNFTASLFPKQECINPIEGKECDPKHYLRELSSLSKLKILYYA